MLQIQCLNLLKYHSFKIVISDSIIFSFIEVFLLINKGGIIESDITVYLLFDTQDNCLISSLYLPFSKQWIAFLPSSNSEQSEFSLVFSITMNSWIFNTFDVFQFVAVNILTDAQVAPFWSAGVSSSWFLNLLNMTWEDLYIFCLDLESAISPKALMPFGGKWYLETSLWTCKVDIFFYLTKVSPDFSFSMLVLELE